VSFSLIEQEKMSNMQKKPINKGFFDFDKLMYVE